ncbi:MAG TPA: DUF4388 domain-containing protein [Planctomycetota bacterium]|jgi:tetratricopeptide (TPR) repeat protein|nr:DUF4388 domain-containing protein [Planctomycetota bacterium]
MALQGDLKGIHLSNVLQDVGNNGLKGTLTIRAGERRLAFWFEKGEIRLVGLGQGRGPSTLNGLVAAGKVPVSQARDGDKGEALVRSLLRKKAVTREAARDALVQEMLDYLCDAFLLKEATFAFEEGEPHEDAFDLTQLDLGARLSVGPAVLEALRRLDEWGEIWKSIVSAEEILVPLPAALPKDAEPTTARLASLLDGQRRLRDLVEETRLGEFAVFRAAAVLLRCGAARPLAVPEALERARAAASRKQHDRVLRMAQFGLEREPGNAELRALAASALEALGRPEEAASELRRLAAGHLERGDKERAAQTYKRLLALAPSDSYARDRLFSLLLDAGKKGGASARTEALAEGEALALAYRKAGLSDQAREVARRLLQTFGEDEDLLESAAEMARRLGDRKEAVALYRRLFDRALARGDREAALLHGRTILRLDPTAEDVARRREALASGERRRIERIRRRWKIGALAAAGVLLVGAPAAYETSAYAHLSKLRAETITLLQRRDLRSLLARYGDFLKVYGWTFASIGVRREQGEIESSFVEEELARVPEGEEALPQAIAGVAALSTSVRGKEARARVEESLRTLRARAETIRDRFLQESEDLARADGPIALQRIAAMTHPLALGALERLATHASPAVRRPAFAALAENRSDQAPEVLALALAAETDRDTRAFALAGLRRRTGEDFGEDEDAWLERLRRRRALEEPGLAPPLHAAVRAERPRLAKGEPLAFEWRIANVGPATVVFSLAPEFVLADASGTKLPASDDPPGDLRTFQLRSGEFVGGRIVLPGATDALEAPGSCLLSFSARVRVEGGREFRIAAAPRRLEVSARE